jgi:Golgi phosphoprotein 3 (GPP34)
MTNYGVPAMRLADELFLIGLDEFSGKPHSAPHLLDTAIAGAALGELLFDGRITIDNGGVHVLDDRPWQEPLSDLIAAEIAARGNGHPGRLWLKFLREQCQIRERVGNRLASAGWVRREESRGLRRSVRWPAVDPNYAASPRVRLGSILRHNMHSIDMRSATLAALASAGGLTKLITLFDESASTRIAEMRRFLPPQVEGLLAAVDAAVAAAAVTVRR